MNPPGRIDEISTHLRTGSGLLIRLFIICTATGMHALTHARNGIDEAICVWLKQHQTVLDLRGGARDIAIAVRNCALLTDSAAMQPEWERLQIQRALYIPSRETLSRMMQSDSGQDGREAMSRIESTEDAALSTLMTAGKLGLDQRQAATIAAGYATSPVTLRRGERISLHASLSGMQTNLRGLVTQIRQLH